MSAPDEGEVLHLIGLSYEAALDSSKWPIFLERLAHVVSASSAILLSVDEQNNSAEFAASFGFDPDWQKSYGQHFVKLDFQTPALLQAGIGKVISNDQVFNMTKMRKTEFYNDFCLPQDKVHNMGALLVNDGSHMLQFGIHRGKSAGAFNEEQARLMEILVPHVTRAVQVHRKITTLTAQQNSALGVLDQLRMGVILTNQSGELVLINRAAEILLAQGGGIGVRHNRLVLPTSQETSRMQKLIADAAHRRHAVAVGGDMRITLSARHEAIHCLVSPISPECSVRWNLSHGAGCVAIFLSKPGNLALCPERLAVLYKLTRAESKLAAKLAAFRSVEEAACDLGITVHTVRVQLRSVFAKTGAKNQAELLTLLATGTLAHCSGE